MDLGPHAVFIVAAYVAAGIVLLGLAVWVRLDYRVQQRKLADLEARGMKRRSDPAKSASP